MNEHIINGQARLLISNGGNDFFAALKLWVQQNCKQKAQETFNDPGRLATQPFDWVEKYFPNSEDALSSWREAVESQFGQIGSLIIYELETIFKISAVRKPTLSIKIGSTQGKNLIFVNFCPLCGKSRVIIQRLLPDKFDKNKVNLKNLFSFLKFSAPECEHGIPIRDSVWQIIQNQFEVNQRFPVKRS